MSKTNGSSDPIRYSRDHSVKRFDAREKMANLGVTALSSTDLLSIVIGSTSAAETLVRRHGLHGLTRLSTEKWQEERGIGTAGAARLSAVFELGRRAYRADGEADRQRVNRPQEAFRHARHLVGLKKEHLLGLYLDAQNGLLHKVLAITKKRLFLDMRRVGV